MSNEIMAREAWHYCCDHLREISLLHAGFLLQGEDGVLVCLYNHPSPMLSGELMQQLGLTTGRVANILRQMEQKGLVLRKQDQFDRRRVLVSLTPQGQAAAQAVSAAIIARLERLTAALGEQDFRAYQALSQKLFACADEICS